MAVQDPKALLTADTPIPGASIPSTDLQMTKTGDVTQVQIVQLLDSINETLKEIKLFMELNGGL